MKTFGLTDKGKIRQENQDSFLIEPLGGDCLVAVLCDGMGGVQGGRVASGLAARLFTEHMAQRLQQIRSRDRLKQHILSSVSHANGIVYNYSFFDPAFTGMGTTLVAAVCRNGRATVVNIGDSRAYHIARKRVRQVTRDHSLVEELIDRGTLTREQAKNHPRRNIITRALGVEPEVEADIFELKLSRGERLLLCSDGLSNLVDEAQLLEQSAAAADPEALCRLLMALALERGAADNVTIVVLEK